MRHNRCVSTQSTSQTLQDEPADKAAASPVQRWRAPAVIRAEALVGGAVGVTVALVFFPLWLGILLAVLLGGWGLSVALVGGAVVVDQAAGRVVVRMGPIVRRIPLTDITGVLVDQGKLSLARAKGGEFSVVMWRRNRLDALLRVPMVAPDAGHAIASAVALAQAAEGDSSESASAESGRTSGRTRARLASAWVCAAGAVEIAAALAVRVHWHSPVLTVLGVVIALVLGVGGLVTLLTGVWLTLTGREAPASADPV